MASLSDRGVDAAVALAAVSAAAGAAALELHSWRARFSQGVLQAVADEWRAGGLGQWRASTLCGVPAAHIKRLPHTPSVASAPTADGKPSAAAKRKGMPPFAAEWAVPAEDDASLLAGAPVPPPADMGRMVGSRGVGVSPNMWTGVPRVIHGRESRRLLFLPYIDDSSNLADTVQETEYEFEGRMSRRHEHAMAAIIAGRTYALLRASTMDSVGEAEWEEEGGGRGVGG
jgi:hypothetical protein